jgi:hypothetical protein
VHRTSRCDERATMVQRRGVKRFSKATLHFHPNRPDMSASSGYIDPSSICFYPLLLDLAVCLYLSSDLSTALCL